MWSDQVDDEEVGRTFGMLRSVVSLPGSQGTVLQDPTATISKEDPEDSWDGLHHTDSCGGGN